MWTAVLLGVLSTAVLFLTAFIIAIAWGKLCWGKHYDAQAKRTLMFMELARRYAKLARASVEVAELLPSDGDNQPEAEDGQADLHGLGVCGGGERPSRELPPIARAAGEGSSGEGPGREDGTP